MACLTTLKQEIRVLENAFPKSDKLFQVVAASVDELTCRFVSKTGKKYDIHANITVSINPQQVYINVRLLYYVVYL